MTRRNRTRTALDRFVGEDLKNFRTNRKLLRNLNLYELPEHIVDLYELLRTTQSGSAASADEIEFTTIFVMWSSYYFQKGLVEVMRLHFSDSWGCLRNAVEAAGLVDLVRRDRKLARTWLNAGTDEALYKIYRKEFRTARLFPREDPLMCELRRVYDWASRVASHGSPYTFMMRLGVVREGTTQQIKFGHQDVKPLLDDPNYVLTMFMSHISTHLRVLQVFARALQDVIEKTKWELHFNAAEVLFSSARERLNHRNRAARLVVPSWLITPVRLPL